MIKDLVIGIALYSDDNVLSYGTNTDIKEFNVDRTRGNREIRLLIHNLTMMEGKFHDPERKENFGIIAKEVKGKESLREKGYQIFDLGDLDAAFRM